MGVRRDVRINAKLAVNTGSRSLSESSTRQKEEESMADKY
jgi:hypothetical protein